jgi:hypothetical protein
VVSGCALLIFQRQKDRTFSVITKKPDQITKIPGVRGDVDDDESLAASLDARVSLVDSEFDKSSFQFVANYDQLLSPSGNVTSLKLVGEPGVQLMLISYSDGNVMAYVMGGRLLRPVTALESVDEALEVGAAAAEEQPKNSSRRNKKHNKIRRDDDISEPPSKVLSFLAHTPHAPSPFHSVQIQTCPWRTLPGASYMVEFFTIGNDFKLVHWGVRCKYGGTEVDMLKNSFDIDVMGVSTTQMSVAC